VTKKFNVSKNPIYPLWLPFHVREDEQDVMETEKFPYPNPEDSTEDILTYSDKEYETLLMHDDWTKEETDYLMQLAHSFHFNFVIIHDRYVWESSGKSPARTRSIEVCGVTITMLL
jgi:SANT/Myb-like domain of DAMP1